MRKLTALAATLLLSACAVGDDYSRPGLSLPDHWPWQKTAEDVAAEQKAAAEKQIPQDWWKSFNDPALTALVDEGLKNNSDLLIAASRVSQARAQLGINESYLYPAIDLQGSANRVSNSRESRTSGFALNSKPYNAFALGAVLNYEIDLWGRVRRANEFARASLLAVEANRDAIRLALASDIAAGYFNLLTLDAQIKVTEETIRSRQEAYDYENAQYRAGVVNELTYRQAESELAAARAALPMLVQAKTEQMSALSVLLGRSPEEIITNKIDRATNINDLPIPPTLPLDLPSTLLERRPDIYAAEQGLVAANADVGIAKAAFFPTVSISALLGLASSEADNLLQGSARQWNAGASAVMPLLDFGRTKYNVEATKARAEEALHTYHQAIRMAFKDVMDSLSAEKTSAERVEALTVQTGSLSEALRVSRLRYDAGYSTYLDVLDSQRNLYQAQLDLISSQRDQLIASVNLYKALGGGWDISARQPAAEAAEPVATARPAESAAQEAAPASAE